MADTVYEKPTKLNLPQPNEFNQQAVKEYVFNETGNIMLASTALASETIEESVRDIFAEVGVFFAAMTKAIATTVNPHAKDERCYSIYDYDAIQSIVDGSGLFIHVTQEDVRHETDTVGVDLSKELVEGLLGLATGVGELGFAQAMIRSMGSEGLRIANEDSRSESKVANIVFVCEYLLGMPSVSAIVVYVDAKKHEQTFQAGPCLKESRSTTTLEMHKDTYMFVTPAAIKKYAGDLASAERDVEFAEYVDYLSNLLLHKPMITSIQTKKDQKEVTDTLVAGETYVVTGEFLTGPDAAEGGGGSEPVQVLKFLPGADSLTINAATIQANHVEFTVTSTAAKAVKGGDIGFFSSGTAEKPYLQAGRSVSVTPKAASASTGTRPPEDGADPSQEGVGHDDHAES